MATKAELQAELAEVETALESIRLGGQSYTISSGGTSRTFTAASYDALMKHRQGLIARIRGKDNERSTIIRPNW